MSNISWIYIAEACFQDSCRYQTEYNYGELNHSRAIIPHSLNEETNYFRIVSLMSYFSVLLLKDAYLGTIYVAIWYAVLYPEIIFKHFVFL